MAYSAAAKPGDVMLTFLVDDLDAAYTRAVEGGAKSIQAPEADHGTKIAHLRDPRRTHHYFGARYLAGAASDRRLGAV